MKINNNKTSHFSATMSCNRNLCIIIIVKKIICNLSLPLFHYIYEIMLVLTKTKNKLFLTFCTFVYIYISVKFIYRNIFEDCLKN